MRTTIAAALAFFSLTGSAQAGIVTAVGAVKALTDINQVLGLVGTASFDEGPTSGNVPLNQYSAQGLTWATGSLTSILSGVTTPGFAPNPVYAAPTGQFLLPIGGGGTQNGQINTFAGVAIFSTAITQVGLTASNNGDQYLTVWNKAGTMLGQVNLARNGSQFIGIDTLGVPIGMVAYGNHDLWNGQPYSINGATTYSDTWVWATGKCTTDAQCDDQNPCTTDTCTVATGQCVRADNALSCSDGNSCTQNDVCSAGACVPGAAVVCAALDACHDVGTCDSKSGLCSSPAKAEGTSCDDGTACTQGDTCMSGTCTSGPPVVCEALDKCHDVGTCNVMTGQCSNPQKPLDCSAKSVCEQAGVCNPVSGVCINAAKPDGVPCGEGICIAGTCSDEAGNTTSSTGTGSTTTGSASTGAGGAGTGGAGVGGASGGTGASGSSATGLSGPGVTSTGSGEGPVTPAGGCSYSTPGTPPVRAPWLLLGLLVPAWRRRRKAPRIAA